MAVSKVELNGETLIDLQSTTAVESDVAQGKVFFKSNGEQAIGTASGGGGGDESISLNTFINNGGKFSYYEGQTLDLTGVNTENLTVMRNMFGFIDNLSTVDLSGFDTTNVTVMYGMFESSLFTSLDLSNFNTTNVTNMGYMFGGCWKLQTLDIRNFDFSNIDYNVQPFAIESMFQDIPSSCSIYVNQAGYDFIESDYNNSNLTGLADISMLQVISNS